MSGPAGEKATPWHWWEYAALFLLMAVESQGRAKNDHYIPARPKSLEWLRASQQIRRALKEQSV